MVLSRKVKLFVASAFVVFVALTAMVGIAASVGAINGLWIFRTPATSDYVGVDRSFHTPPTSDYVGVDRSFHTPQTSNYRAVDRSFHTPPTSDYRPASTAR